MNKQIIEISNSPAHLSISHSQLKIKFSDDNIIQRPIEDIGVIILNHPALTYTQKVLTELSANNVTVLICDDKYLPTSVIVPLTGNSEQTARLHVQISAKVPLKKQLWKFIIQTKIRNQAKLLYSLYKSDFGLKSLIYKVRSGDPENYESQASRIYWKKLFGSPEFKRKTESDHRNMCLNYGYAILRASISRSLCGSGLHPSMGIHHINKYNPFCLADDLIEPLRPFVDQEVVSIFKPGVSVEHFGNEEKKKLIGVLTKKVSIHRRKMPLFEALHNMTASLYMSFERGENLLEIPQW